MRVLLIDCCPYMPPATPISLGNLGAVLKSLGHEARVLSLGSTSRFSPRALESFLEDFEPRLVGFGAYQRNISLIRGLSRTVKEILPDASVVLGGPQGAMLPGAALADLPEIDYLGRGEGEQVLRAIVEALEGGSGDEPIPGVTSRTAQGECITGPAAPVPADLDGYPSPWLSGVLDPSEMEESILLTSRGCPNSCSFCCTPAAFGETRCQSVDRVLEDIECVSRKGNGRLWFADPNFSFSENRVVEILEGILTRGLEVKMWIETRADMVSPWLLSLLKRAGVHTIAMGLESASPGVYPGLRKGIEPGKIQEAARAALDTGLEVELFSQFALPGESLADALETLQFVKDCGIKIQGNSNAQQMQLYFGSEIHSNFRSFGIRPLREDLPSYLAMGADFETDWMSREEIEQVKSAWLAESLDGGKRVVS